jgi:hypothetical protein
MRYLRQITENLPKGIFEVMKYLGYVRGYIRLVCRLPKEISKVSYVLVVFICLPRGLLMSEENNTILT